MEACSGKRPVIIVLDAEVPAKKSRAIAEIVQPFFQKDLGHIIGMREPLLPAERIADQDLEVPGTALGREVDDLELSGTQLFRPDARSI